VKINRKKKLKRVKRIVDAESDEEADNHEENEREAIERELFDGEDDVQPHTSGKRAERESQIDDRYGAVSGSEESEDEDNFIVDEDDRPISKPRKRKGHRYNDEAMQQAQDIFGVEFDFDELDNYGEEGMYDESEEETYEDEMAEGDVDSSRTARRKSKGKRRSMRKSIYEVYEPSELERSHLTDFDNKVRNTDVPERFQLRSIPVSPADDAEIEEESDWIFTNAFSTPTISIQNQGVDGSKLPLAGKKDSAVLLKIREALKFIRNSLFEVPFIAYYRKEHVCPDLEMGDQHNLRINDLWTVYKWDEKWCRLQKRKANMIKLFKSMQEFQSDEIMKDPESPMAEGMRLINDFDIERINNISTFEELHDCWLQFQLYYSTELPAMKQEILRRERERRLEQLTEEDAERVMQEEEEAINMKLTSLRLAQRKDTYTICKEAGIIGLAIKFGLTPEQFAENVRDNYVKHEVEQYPIDPLEVAHDYVCNRFATPDAVLKAAKFMVAKQISSDPLVRQCIRKEFFERAKMHVKPTKKGYKEIDENHPCYTYKYLKNKPVMELTGDQFLQLIIAQKEGLITFRITIDREEFMNTAPQTTHTYFDEIKQFYQKDEFSDLVLLWNKQREEALEIALNEFLYPSFEKELKAKLLQEAEEGIILACRTKLQNWLKVAPYKPTSPLIDDEDFDIREGVRIMGLAFISDDDNPTFAALIDGDGEVTDHLRLPYFMFKRFQYASPQEKEMREKDKDKLKRFILAKKPHVICIGAESMAARNVVEDVMSVIQDLIETEQFPSIPVELVDDELSSVYMNSKRAVAEFPEYPALLRQAISLARRMFDPLIEFSQLCTADEEILCIKYHSLQSYVSKDLLLENLYFELIHRTNDVGVDINRALVHPFTAQLVQFVCGLGPRKSAALIRTLKKQQTPLLESRTQLVMNCQIGKTVFINCAGFIRIDTTQLSDTGTDTYIEVLDSTRVHPEAYEWARKMAVDALEYDENESDVNPAGALEEIVENSGKLQDLDLDAFAEELTRQGFGSKRITLYDIRSELTERYKDNRTVYTTPQSEEVFHLLTKETPETFYIGKLVIGKVVSIARKKPQSDQLDQANPIRSDDTGLWQCPFCMKGDFAELSEVWAHFDSENCPGQPMGIRVRLDNGILGMVDTRMISDKEINDPSERVQIGMTVHARVVKINTDKFFVELTCRTSDLNDRNNHWRPPKDFCYDYEAEDVDNKTDEETKKKQNRQTYIKRIIVHPSFHNIDYQKAERMLESMDQGEAIIRPSSKGTDHLTLTWKVTDGINQHVDILEQSKDNAFSLGHQLYINNEAYEDLDEIIARYVHPMAAFARELINFRYYRSADGGKKEIIERVLTEEKKKNPSKIHYIISASREFPGKFLLSCLPRTTVKHEYITVTPEGFRYRKNSFRSVNSLFRWFKDHFRDPIPQTPQPTRTPMGQSSQITGDTTPGINQAIQRAAASMGPSMFNTLSQVNVQTPSFAGTSMHSSFTHPNFYPQGTPTATPVMTPAGNQMGTPRGYPAATPQQSGWNTGSMPPPNQPAPRQGAPQQGRPRSRVGSDWSSQAENWNKKRPMQPRTPLYATPGASSQMSISPNSSPNYNKGDQTPLLSHVFEN
ncbi:Transcription elongation factor SPT6-like protein, partial [Leptotrombidium deliense]